MSINNMTIDNEFRYIVQWFHEWSELQRDDFIPALVEYLIGHRTETSNNNIDTTLQMNNLECAMHKSLSVHDRPMSLFQCRLKLFKQWHPKWPLDFKKKLQSKIMEIDSNVGEKIRKMIDGDNTVNSMPNNNGQIISDDKRNLMANDSAILFDEKTNECKTVAIHNDSDCSRTDSAIKAVAVNEPVKEANVSMEKQVFDESSLILVTHSQQQEKQQESDSNVAVTTLNISNAQTTINNKQNANIPLIV